MYAIKRVILHIKSAHVPQATVCTDSKSTLQALQRTEDLTHPGVYEIHKLILSLRADQHVTFLWIPGHSGISGNDRADSMAKEAAMLPDPEELPVALGDILHLTKIQFSKYLQEQWNNVHANHMFVIKPVLKPWSSCLQRSRERERGAAIADEVRTYPIYAQSPIRSNRSANLLIMRRSGISRTYPD